MELELRNYQLEQLEFLIDSDDNSCVQSPTGTGKSVVIAAYVEYLLKMGKQRIAIITPRKELVKNLKKYFGNRATMAFTNEKPNLFAPILITTFQSANKYMKLYNPDHYISDESHLSVTKTWCKAIDEGVRHDGFTATPMRYDGRKLRTHYSKLYKSQPIQWFIDNGYLSEVNIHQAEFDDPVRIGYYYSQKDDLMKQYEILGCKPKIDETVDLYLSKHKGEKSLFFVTSEGHGVDLEEALCRKGVNARFLTHKTSNKRRDNDFQAFAKDGLDCLINMELFTTGIDVPNCLNVFACRFTKSVALLFQMFGRGTRKSEGKIYNYYDLAGNHYYHDYDILTFNAWSLDNLDEEIMMSASPRNRDSGGVYVKYEGYDEFIGLTSNLFEKKKKAQDTFSRKTIKSILQCGNMGYREKIMEICFADVAVEHKVYGLRVLKISEDNIKQYLSI